MGKDLNEDRLGVIANLLALQIVQDKNLVDASWVLARAGMKYSDIGQILGISERSVSAHISNKKKQREQAAKRKSGKKVKGE